MSGCPVKDEASEGNIKSESSCPVNMGSNGGRTWMEWMGFGQSDSSSQSADGSVSTGYNPAANDMAFNQKRYPGQKKALGTLRSTSTIMKSDFTPEHQPKDGNKWVYPSEQQYFNAMKRKGYNPQEDDMPVVLAIHNMVNERGWLQVKQWEALHSDVEPKLKQFVGRPKDLSPKARFLTFMGYEAPFDRHDWVVERENGDTIRYVLDFYRGKSHPSAKAPISMHLDVRPALDTPSAIFDRIYVFGMQNLLGKNPLRMKFEPDKDSAIKNRKHTSQQEK
jgi:cytochrome c heme-lyase